MLVDGTTVSMPDTPENRDFLIYSGRLKTWRQPDKYGYYCVGVIREIGVNLWLKQYQPQINADGHRLAV